MKRAGLFCSGVSVTNFLYCHPKKNMSSFYLLQNSEACVLTKTKRQAHITYVHVSDFICFYHVGLLFTILYSTLDCF